MKNPSVPSLSGISCRASASPSTPADSASEIVHTE